MSADLSSSYKTVWEHAQRVCAPTHAIAVRLLSHRPAMEGFYTDPRRMADDVTNNDHDGMTGCYWMAGPVSLDLLARADNKMLVTSKDSRLSAVDTDVLFRPSITLDIDPIRKAGISSTDSEHERAILKAYDIATTLSEWYQWPSPTIIDSGNGAHLRWDVRLENTPDSTALVKAVLHKAASMFDDDYVQIDKQVFNPSRIFRIPGTVARKGENLPSRPWRVSRVLVQGEAL